MKPNLQQPRLSFLLALVVLTGLTAYAYRTGVYWPGGAGRKAPVTASAPPVERATGASTSKSATNSAPAEMGARAALAAPLQSGGSYNLAQTLISGGGGLSANGATSINGSVGQTAAAASSGGSYTISGGFWAGQSNGNGCPTITVSPATATLPTGTIGTGYSQTFAQTGGVGTISWSATGTLPTGLTLAATTGLLAGTPSAAGTFNFTISATDSNACTGNQTYSLTTACPVITVNPASLPIGNVNTAYQQMLSQTEVPGTAAWSVSAGALPSGVTLNASSGLLAGTPTQTGTFNFTARVTGTAGCFGERAYGLTISACPAITLSPAALPDARLHVNYSQPLTASGGTGTYIFSVTAGTLPTGLMLAANGSLAGAPTQAGLFNFTIQASDSNNCPGIQAYALTVRRGVVKADFDGDGQTDLSVFRPTAVDPVPNWLALSSLNNQALNFSWGGGYAPYFDVPVPGDYDGDGQTDYAIWRGADTFWYLRRSSDGQPVLVFYGANFAPYFDIPVPGDFDGDGKTDIAVFRRSGTWFIRRSTDGGDTIINHGQAGDVPLAADFDGDGKCDLGLFRPDAVAPTPNWLILQSSTNTVVSLQWGGGYAPYFDTPVPADYDGDGKADLAIWRGADSIWYIRPSASPNNPILDLWGANYAPYFDIPTPGDYDGDAKADIAVFRRTGTWFVKRSSNGSNLMQEQGQAGDVPLPANGVR